MEVLGILKGAEPKILGEIVTPRTPTSATFLETMGSNVNGVIRPTSQTASVPIGVAPGNRCYEWSARRETAVCLCMGLGCVYVCV